MKTLQFDGKADAYLEWAVHTGFSNFHQTANETGLLWQRSGAITTTTQPTDTQALRAAILRPDVEFVELAVCETGIGAHIEVIDIDDEATARERRFLGSPTILVDGHDIEPGADARTDYSVSCRVYRTADGFKRLPDPQWMRDALARGG